MQEQQIIRALESQLRPGVGADSDSVQVLLESLAVARREEGDLETRYQAEYAGFLNVVQQAQLVLSMVRFERQVENLLRRRM